MMEQQDLFEVKRCSKCSTELTTNNWNPSWRKVNRFECKQCHKKHNVKSNPKNNPNRMWVNGKFIPKTHPLHKPGRYKTFEDAAFSSLAKYEIVVEGQVYVITNPHFAEWVKVGMAIDSEDRLNGYQTSSPFRDYMLFSFVDVNDRRQAEAAAHAELEKLYERKGEWFKCTPQQAREVVIRVAEDFK